GGDLAGESCVYSIAKRVEDGSVICRNCWVELPDIRFRDDDVFGKCAIRIDADDLHEPADVRLSCPALETFAAVYVHRRRDKGSFFDSGDLIANGGNVSTKFVTRDKRRMNAISSPLVP